MAKPSKPHRERVVGQPIDRQLSGHMANVGPISRGRDEKGWSHPLQAMLAEGGKGCAKLLTQKGPMAGDISSPAAPKDGNGAPQGTWLLESERESQGCGGIHISSWKQERDKNQEGCQSQTAMESCLCHPLSV